MLPCTTTSLLRMIHWGATMKPSRRIVARSGFVDGYLYLATALIGNRRLSEALDAYDAYLLCAEEGDRRYQVEVLAQKLRAALGR